MTITKKQLASCHELRAIVEIIVEHEIASYRGITAELLHGQLLLSDKRTTLHFGKRHNFDTERNMLCVGICGTRWNVVRTEILNALLAMPSVTCEYERVVLGELAVEFLL